METGSPLTCLVNRVQSYPNNLKIAIEFYNSLEEYIKCIENFQ